MQVYRQWTALTWHVNPGCTATPRMCQVVAGTRCGVPKKVPFAVCYLHLHLLLRWTSQSPIAAALLNPCGFAELIAKFHWSIGVSSLTTLHFHPHLQLHPANPAIMSSKSQIPFGTRASSHPNPLARKLFEVAEAKKSNVTVSADVTTTKELLDLADRMS